MPIETSAVKITDLQAESVGYNSARIVWTVENPNREYIYNHRLSVTASIQPVAYTAGLMIQITPWYDYDTLYGKLFYRAAGDADWKTRSFSIPSSTMFVSEILSGLSSETDYEYYITLSSSFIALDCLTSVGSQTEPLSFTTTQLETYEDSQFQNDLSRT